MAKFVVVKNAPEKLEKGEVVINPPTFLAQIQENARKAPRKQLTAINHLREILNSIAVKYDPEMDAMRFRLVNYEGLPYSNDQDLSAILLRIIKTEYPKVLESYIEHELRNRPTNTKLVYFTGDFTSTGPFYRHGLDLLEEKDVESYMTGKPKKIVGRPAVKGNTFKVDVEGNSRPATDEEVDAINNMAIVSETTHTTKY